MWCLGAAGIGVDASGKGTSLKFSSSLEGSDDMKDLTNTAIALFDYTAQEEMELSFAKVVPSLRSFDT